MIDAELTVLMDTPATQLSNDQRERIKELLSILRDQSKTLQESSIGLCGDETNSVFHLPKLILSSAYNYTEKLTVLEHNEKNGSARALTVQIRKGEAEALIKKLSAFVDLCETQRVISSLRYKIPEA